jgi:hypothetical protein
MYANKSCGVACVCPDAGARSEEEEGQSQAAAPKQQAPEQAQLELPLGEGARAALQREWEALTAAAEALRPIERYRVVSVAFRRRAHAFLHLLLPFLYPPLKPWCAH